MQKLETGKQQTLEGVFVSDVYTVKCAHCGKWFVAVKAKRHKVYCSNACKQAAYRRRKLIKP